MAQRTEDSEVEHRLQDTCLCPESTIISITQPGRTLAVVPRIVWDPHHGLVAWIAGVVATSRVRGTATHPTRVPQACWADPEASGDLLGPTTPSGFFSDKLVRALVLL